MKELWLSISTTRTWEALVLIVEGLACAAVFWGLFYGFFFVVGMLSNW